MKESQDRSLELQRLLTEATAKLSAVDQLEAVLERMKRSQNELMESLSESERKCTTAFVELATERARLVSNQKISEDECSSLRESLRILTEQLKSRESETSLHLSDLRSQYDLSLRSLTGSLTDADRARTMLTFDIQRLKDSESVKDAIISDLNMRLHSMNDVYSERQVSLLSRIQSLESEAETLRCEKSSSQLRNSSLEQELFRLNQDRLRLVDFETSNRDLAAEIVLASRGSERIQKEKDRYKQLSLKLMHNYISSVS